MEYKRSAKKRALKYLLVGFIALLLSAAVFFTWLLNLFPGKYYTASDFGLDTLVSPNDANGNGVDDFADIVLGARLDAEAHPRYDGAYWEGGYPPDDIGVCTDTIWRAFAHAGYDLKSLMDTDIAAHTNQYPGLDATGPDPNIDFRRVCNLDVFFSRHAEAVTMDLEDIGQWQPGDIVVFNEHIAICSDKRNSNGLPWLIHNGGQPMREEDALEKLLLYKTLIGHYRWIPQNSGSGSLE